MRLVTIVTLLALAFGPSGAAQAKSAKKTAKKAAVQKVSPEKIDQQFETFCAEWMEKLAKREHDNIENIKWNTKSEGVEGEYVGYPQDHTCSVKNEDKIPVGTIKYQEVRYAKDGSSITEAQHNLAKPVESTAVTELFRYDHGKWIY